MLQSDVGAMISSKGMDALWSSEQEQHNVCHEHTCQADAIRELSPLSNMIPTKRKNKESSVITPGDHDTKGAKPWDEASSALS